MEEGEKKTRKRITLLIAVLMMALSMSFGAAAAFADPNCKGPPTDRPGRATRAASQDRPTSWAQAAERDRLTTTSVARPWAAQRGRLELGYQAPAPPFLALIHPSA
jgi:hypothetical protein